jgi:integrase
MKRHVEANKLRTQADIKRILTKYIYPAKTTQGQAWQDCPFREIKRADVTKLLDHIEDDRGPRQADIVLAIVRKMMNWYASRNDYVVPVVRGMQRSNGVDRKRKRILDDNEIQALWTACGELGTTFGAIVKLLLLSGQRREKVATMKWDELVDGEWRIPSEAREKTNAGKLKLPQVALDLIKAQPLIADNPYVFAVAVGSGAFNSFSQRKEELDKKLPEKMPPWVLHDLRRTARSLMSRAGVRPDIAERVLGHAIPGVEGVYDRHGYGDEKAEALKRLAALLDTIINPPPDNVVRLSHAAGPAS